MAITEDTANQPSTVTTTTAWNSTAITTASFTPQAGTLLIALVSGGDSTSTVTAAITDSVVGTWTLLKRQNTVSGSAATTNEIWCRYLSAGPGSMTVSAKSSIASAGGQLTVRCLLGAASTQSGATAGLGNISTAAAMQASLAAGTGSMVYGAATNWTTNAAMTVLANTTAVTAFSDASNGAEWSAFKSSGATAGTATYGYSSSVQGAIAMAEILAAATASSPLPITVVNRVPRFRSSLY